MATKIIHKKSSVASSVPTAGDLEAGELAINLADKKLYSKTTGGTVITVGTSDYNDLENTPDTSVFLPKSGGTMTGTLTMGANNINMSNANITGVNQITINDPGEGILFQGTNNVHLKTIDDSTDDIVNFDGASQLQVNGSKVWTAGNDGSGSGLDADTLDGQHASAFLTAHPSISAASSVNNTGRTYIQDITVDSNGHVTGITSATETVTNTDTNTTDWRVANSAGTQQFAVSAAEQVRFAGSGASSVSFDAATQTITISSTDTNTDTNTTYSAGSGLGLSGTTFSHSDTSSQGSVNNSNGTVIQDITLDGFGHITGLGSVNLDGRYYTESESDSRFARVDTATQQNFTGSIKVSTNNSTGGGIVLADDGDIVDLNDGYASMRFSNGVRVYSANGSGSVRHTLASNGDFTATGNVTAYSDARLKDNIETIGSALDKVSKLRGVTYNRTDLEDSPRHTGVIAQEVEKVLPEVVAADDEGIKHVAYGNMVGLLIEAIKELKAEVEVLKNGSAN